MKKVLKGSLFLIMILCLFALSACDKSDDVEKPVPEAKSDAVQKLPKLLDLGAHECIPCKMMAPILEGLTKEYEGVFDVEFIDVWQPENKEKARAHGIRSIPTQIFFDASGKELWRHEGFISREDILKAWKELGFTFKTAQQENDASTSAAAESE